ncbi:hypothetical protein UFOVP51_67 [uncultured Caudovirales phage]|uniref:Uncharacterized protein n=1 Tax=uncultured Caudovirales phage TaxID=2100421 RepID=A0A6J5KSI3_9CAUD|nr:hypothetical protein UFOVP51_67 [uncultured Caudovirales phage]CAB4240893.1 hypothetical protein UFOVP34_39 [uncultured Caudovirales phage]
MGYEVLYNFISPVTGRILCDTDKVLVGDINGIAIPSAFIPIGALPDLPMGNIWIGNDMNRPIPNPTITIDNLPNLSAGKVWIGNGMIPSRPVEGTAPQGPAGPPGPPGAANQDPNNLANSIVDGAAGSFVKFGLEQLFKEGVGGFFKTLIGVSVAVDAASQLGSTIIDAVAVSKDKSTNYVDYRTSNFTNNSLLGLQGAQGLSGISTIFFQANMSFQGGRLENIAPSPLADYDAVNAKWVWDLLNDNVEIIWTN